MGSPIVPNPTNPTAWAIGGRVPGSRLKEPSKVPQVTSELRITASAFLEVPD